MVQKKFMCVLVKRRRTDLAWPYKSLTHPGHRK
jgi:hypothetical protein